MDFFGPHLSNTKEPSIRTSLMGRENREVKTISLLENIKMGIKYLA